MHLLDLAYYELGNVLLRRRGWRAEEVAEQMQELNDVVAGVLPVSAAWTGQAATLAERYGLSFYDASWAAAARHCGLALISADRQLLAADLAGVGDRSREPSRSVLLIAEPPSRRRAAACVHPRQVDRVDWRLP